jgi:hypothetical protein
MFRKKSQASSPVDAAEATVDPAELDDAAAPSDSPPRDHGPWDVSEIADSADRIDLGSLLIKGVAGLSMQVQMDEKTQRVAMVTLVLDDAAVQVQAFAAPRASGIWHEVRPAIAASVTSGGGLVEEIDGRFGTELRARVPGPNKELQPARFVGVDGPRWFLRGLFLGSAAQADGHEGLMQVFSDIAVVRGDEAKPSGEPLPLILPERDGDAAAQDSTPDATSP